MHWSYCKYIQSSKQERAGENRCGNHQLRSSDETIQKKAVYVCIHLLYQLSLFLTECLLQNEHITPSMVYSAEDLCLVVQLSDSVTLWTVACQLFCPWDFPGKNTEVCCHFLLQGIFLTQGSNLGLPYCRQTLYHLSHRGSPMCWND